MTVVAVKGAFGRHVESIKVRHRPGSLFQLEVLPDGESLPAVLKPMAKCLREYRSQTPPCVYFLVKDDEVIYIGQSVNLPSRIEAHLETKIFDRVYYVPAARRDLSRVEGALIRFLKPKMNGHGPLDRGRGKILYRLGFRKVSVCQEN